MLDQIGEIAEATTHSAISVVNAIPTGRGATIGIDIPCRVTVGIRKNLDSKIKIETDTRDPHNLVATCVRYTMKRLRVKLPRSSTIVVRVKSKIPPAVGLKSSSAVSVAVVKAVQELYSSKLDTSSILKISSTASKDTRASLTGAYDDASAALLGGMVFTDNRRFKLLKHSRIRKELGSNVAILVPNQKKKLTSSIESNVFSQFRNESFRAFEFAFEGEIPQAMFLNSVVLCASLGYSIRPVVSAISEGATASGVTGKGPAIAALCDSSKVLHRVTKKWYEETRNCRVILTKIVQPEKLAR